MKKLLFCAVASISLINNVFSKTTEIGIVFTKNLIETSQAYKDMVSQLQAAESSVMKATANLQQLADKKMNSARQVLQQKGITNEKDPLALSLQHEIEKELRSLQDEQTAAKIHSLELSSKFPAKFAELQKDAANNICKERGLSMIIEDSLVLGLGESKNFINATESVQKELDKLFEQKSNEFKLEKKSLLFAENKADSKKSISSGLKTEKTSVSASAAA